MWQAAVVFLLLASTSVAATPPCDVSGGDAVAVATARATVEAACSCGTAPSRGSWQRCVRETLEPLIGSSLSTSCARLVRRTENRSTCGTNKEVCCRTGRRGTTRGALRTLRNHRGCRQLLLGAPSGECQFGPGPDRTRRERRCRDLVEPTRVVGTGARRRAVPRCLVGAIGPALDDSPEPRRF